MTGRKELIQAIAERYRNSSRADKKKILDEFTEVTGFHRKHAIRALRKTKKHLNGASAESAPRSRVYDQAVVEALTILWEAADRICGKRLKQAIPALLEAMELHGHLAVDAEVRRRLLTVGAATIDRLLASVRGAARQGPPQSGHQHSLAQEHRSAHVFGLERSCAGILRNGHGGTLRQVRRGQPRPQPGVDRHRVGLDRRCRHGCS